MPASPIHCHRCGIEILLDELVLAALAELKELTLSNFADLAAVTGQISSTVERVAADLTALRNGGNLTPEQQAVLDKAVADLTGDETTLEAADPQPAPAPAAAVDTAAEPTVA